MREFVRALIPRGENKFLAQLVTKYSPAIWMPPGGKVEHAETPLQCLIRELKEELDVEVKSAHLFTDKVFDFGIRGRWRGYLFYTKTSGSIKNMEPDKCSNISNVHYLNFHQEYHEILAN